MRKFSLFTAIMFMVSGSPALQAKAVAKITPMEQAATVYNNIGTTDRLFNLMKIGASEDDRAFLESMLEKTKGRKLPLAKASGELLYFNGLAKPLKAVDLKQGVFVYDNHQVKLDFNKSIRFNYELLEQVVHPKPVALLQWILPQAEADFDFSSVLSGMMAGAGMGMMFGSSNPGTQMMGGAMAMIGVFGLISNNNRSSSYNSPMMAAAAPQQVTCFVDQTGVQRALISGPNGRQIVTVSGMPGQPYQITPNPGYPYQYAQNAAGQLSSVCGNPQSLMGVNYALAPSAYPAPMTNFYNGYATMSKRAPASAFPAAPARSQPVNYSGVSAAR